MRGFGLEAGRWALLLILALTVGTRISSAQVPVLDGFSWLDLKSDTDKVAAVTKALEQQKYTALREIAVVDDAALVITTTRDNPQAQPEFDHYTVYSVSLKDGSVQQLLAASKLRLLDWECFTRDGQSELLATYDDCTNCMATTFSTSFYIDPKTKLWNARWKREKSGAPLAAQNAGAGETGAHLRFAGRERWARGAGDVATLPAAEQRSAEQRLSLRVPGGSLQRRGVLAAAAGQRCQGDEVPSMPGWRSDSRNRRGQNRRSARWYCAEPLTPRSIRLRVNPSTGIPRAWWGRVIPRILTIKFYCAANTLRDARLRTQDVATPNVVQSRSADCISRFEDTRGRNFRILQSPPFRIVY